MSATLRLVLAAVAGTLVAGLAAAWLLRAPPPARAATPELDWLSSFREDGRRHRVRLAGFLEAARWEEAVAEAARLRELDPIAEEAAVATETAAREQEAARLLAAAEEQRSLGRDEEALEGYLQVPRTSRSFPRARIEVRALALGAVAGRLRGDCLGLSRSDPARALQRCRRYLDLTCNARRDPEIQERVDRLARRAGSWSCPVELSVWFAQEGERGAEVDRAVLRKYDAGTADALLLHARDGRTRAAVEKLLKLRRAPQAAALAEQLRRIDAGLQEGRSEFLAGRLREADRAWGEAFEADARVMPPGFSSAPVTVARRELARGWLEEARRLEERLQVGPALAAVSSGLAADPASVELLEVRQRLEGAPD